VARLNATGQPGPDLEPSARSAGGPRQTNKAADLIRRRLGWSGGCRSATAAAAAMKPCSWRLTALGLVSVRLLSRLRARAAWAADGSVGAGRAVTARWSWRAALRNW